MGCGSCPNSQAAQAIIQTKQALGVTPIPADLPSEGMVRMEYTGPRRGAVTYFGKKLRYRFGNNPIDKFQDVAPEDVERLLGTGEIVVVKQKLADPTPPSGFVPDPLPEAPQVEPEPEKEPEIEPAPLEIDISRLNAAEAIKMVNTLALSLSGLTAMLRQEQATKKRKTVIEALEKKLNDA